jgi:hypothetical protein
MFAVMTHPPLLLPLHPIKLALSFWLTLLFDAPTSAWSSTTGPRSSSNRSTSIRALVLLIGFIASLLAVVLGAGSDFSFVSDWARINLDLNIPNLDHIIKFAVFLLPAVASSIMFFATQNTPSMQWINYRFSAELIRRAIYKYIMGAGDFFGNSPAECTKMLRDAVRKADAHSGPHVDLMVAPVEFSDVRFKRALRESFDPSPREKQPLWKVWSPITRLIQRLWHRIRPPAEVDDGKSVVEPTFDLYYKNRFKDQLQWYQSKADRDYDTTRRWQLAGLVVGIFGSVLTYLGYAPWVAVTTAAAVTISSLATLRMYGLTYAVYLIAVQELREREAEWKDNEVRKRTNPAECAQFIAWIEDIFQREIETWVQVAEQSHIKTDTTISQVLTTENAGAQLVASGNVALAGIIQAPANTPEGKIISDANEQIAEKAVEIVEKLNDIHNDGLPADSSRQGDLLSDGTQTSAGWIGSSEPNRQTTNGGQSNETQ